MLRIFVLLLLWLLVFLPLYPELVATWLTHSDNSHGLLVPFVSVYFILKFMPEIQSLPKRSSIWGLLILGVSMAVYLLSYAGGVAFLARLMIVSSLIGLIIYNYGIDVYRRLIFPLLFLLISSQKTGESGVCGGGFAAPTHPRLPLLRDDAFHEQGGVGKHLCELCPICLRCVQEAVWYPQKG